MSFDTLGQPPSRAASCRNAGFSTKAIRIGQDPDPTTGATIVPIYQTSTYTLEAVGSSKGFDYSRSINPTRLALERQLAALEDAEHCVTFASGMAAIFAACSILRTGDHIVATQDIYGGTYRLFSEVLAQYGILVTYVDMTDLEATRKAIQPATKLIWIETPSNPVMRLIDIAAVSALATAGQIVAVDNTFCSPYGQRPLALGAHLSVHSTTKFLNGHSDVVGGCVITHDAALYERLAFHQNAVGAIPSPFDAFLTMRGAKTLALRMERHAENAMAIATWLEQRPEVDWVGYPGLSSHPHHQLAQRQMQNFGGILSFRIRAGAERALTFARTTRVFNLATSIGGVESLICSPYTMTHGPVPVEVKEGLGITLNLLRLSVGIEDITDLIADLEQAFITTAS